MKFIKKSNPHIKDSDTTSKIMTRFLLALAPIICFSIFKNSIVVYFKTEATIIEALHPVFIIIVSIIISLVSEFLFFKLVSKKNFDATYAVIPGLLLALILPINTPLWLVILGAFLSIIIGKMIFGGLGENIFNPALVGYLIIMSSYSNLVGSYLNLYEMDTITTATPLSNLANLNYNGSYDAIVSIYGSLLNFFIGNIPGALAETSKILILVAFIYLSITKTIKWIIPTSYILTVFFMTSFIAYYLDIGIWYPVFHILSGGLLFGAVFMATDPVTSPITNIGQIIHGILLGVLTVILRFLTPYNEGVATSILFMNMLVPLFDKIGLRIKAKLKNIWIIIVVLIFIIIISLSVLCNKFNIKENEEYLSDKVTIQYIKEEKNIKIYNLTSKGWGMIKADVETVDNEIKSITIINNNGETQWSEIEKSNYIEKIINNQNNIDSLDAVSGSTYTSDALKNIVRKIKFEQKSNK